MPCVLVLVLFSLCTGCLSTAVGDTWYSNNSINVNVSHSGEPTDVFVQVTVYRITNMTQEQYDLVSVPVFLLNGGNTITVPVELASGNYKLYVYILKGGDRKTAVIRDIVVE
ncbi:MAG: hypothetical protein PHT99_07875 [Methanoregula sp.]|nr:hypothetical protein [Methanoregula sp.]